MNCITDLNRRRSKVKCLRVVAAVTTVVDTIRAGFLRITRCQLCSFNRSLEQSSREMTTINHSLKVCSTRRPTSHRTGHLSFSSPKTKIRTTTSHTKPSSGRRQRCPSRHLPFSAALNRAPTLSRSTGCTPSGRTYGAALLCPMSKCRSMATLRPITITTIRSRITCSTMT